MRPDPFDAAATAAAIASAQRPDGAIPHEPEGLIDPWDHVEAAMAMATAGLHKPAERAYLWLASTQRRDGSWPSAIRGHRVEDATADANFAAYAAAGAWHHFLATGDESFLEEMWPTVERAIEFALALQAPGGEILWARDAEGRPWPGALLTSSSCIHLSLRCAIDIAARLGYARPRWTAGLAALAEAIRSRPQAFEDKSRYSMDWYYPVLGGAVSGEAAKRRLLDRWDEFVVLGVGCRCVADRPWVTGAETAELVIALQAAGLRAEAEELMGWVHRLRHSSGAYWTGITFPEAELWPEERPTWTSGAVLLAANVLYGEGPTAAFFSAGSEDLQTDLEPVA